MNNLQNQNSGINNISSNNNRSNIMPINKEENKKAIEEIVEKYFQEFKQENNNKFNELDLKMDSKNEEIFKLLEQYSTTINNLNTKMEKIKVDFETENKKKLNHLTEKIEKSIIGINESNMGFNNESRFIGNENINSMKTQIRNNMSKLETEIKEEIIEIREQILSHDKRILELEKSNNNKNDKPNNNIDDKPNNNIGFINKINNIEDIVQKENVPKEKVSNNSIKFSINNSKMKGNDTQKNKSKNEGNNDDIISLESLNI